MSKVVVAGAVALLAASGSGVASATAEVPVASTVHATLDCNQPQGDHRVVVSTGPTGHCFVSFKYIGDVFPDAHEFSPATLVSKVFDGGSVQTYWDCGATGCSPVGDISDTVQPGDYPIEIRSVGRTLDLMIRIHG